LWFSVIVGEGFSKLKTICLPDALRQVYFKTRAAQQSGGRSGWVSLQDLRGIPGE
jgi:hypothetical protein